MDDKTRDPSEEEQMAEMLVDRALTETPRDPLREALTGLLEATAQIHTEHRGEWRVLVEAEQQARAALASPTPDAALVDAADDIVAHCHGSYAHNADDGCWERLEAAILAARGQTHD